MLTQAEKRAFIFYGWEVFAFIGGFFFVSWVWMLFRESYMPFRESYQPLLLDFLLSAGLWLALCLFFAVFAVPIRWAQVIRSKRRHLKFQGKV